MKLPRFRLRTLMIAVAIVGGLLAWHDVRRRRFLELANWHDAQTFGEISARVSSAPTSRSYWWDASGTLWLSAKYVAKNRWHISMAVKYRRAARHPWLPVAPDPPEPK